ncbi:hypothetical protein ACM66B_005325 [Microbotryomycetes sp. NB124-2]
MPEHEQWPSPTSSQASAANYTDQSTSSTRYPNQLAMTRRHLRLPAPIDLPPIQAHDEVFRTGSTKKPAALHFERLEFIGDRILNLVASQVALAVSTSNNDGGLGTELMFLMQGTVAAKLASRFGFQAKLESLRISSSLLGDRFESYVGALYLEQGVESVSAFLVPLFRDVLADNGLLRNEHPTTLTWSVSQATVQIKVPEHLAEPRKMTRQQRKTAKILEKRQERAAMEKMKKAAKKVKKETKKAKKQAVATVSKGPQLVRKLSELKITPEQHAVNTGVESLETAASTKKGAAATAKEDKKLSETPYEPLKYSSLDDATGRFVKDLTERSYLHFYRKTSTRHSFSPKGFQPVGIPRRAPANDRSLKALLELAVKAGSVKIETAET